ncbi:MAG: Zn-dependent alcohol dehydrogenase [Anaerolineaceae bacterium]|nr:Zn-dependent alcohol dehydrogenase [Anaerolineaceae bacterium]|tara:strand:- start:104 stop:1123 length:1020 start_codon:yes stop_codon:yes gene_type:complete
MNASAAYYSGSKEILVNNYVPSQPDPLQIQVQPAYSGICGTDLHIFNGAMDQRVALPHIMGHETAGVISSLGTRVNGFEIGQPVTIMPLNACGKCAACYRGLSHICYQLEFLGIDTPGSFQSFWNVPAHTVHALPSTASLSHAAMIEPIAVACHDVRLGKVTEGDRVVVLGCGPIGILVAMVARSIGAEVTISEINDFRLELASSLGFTVINPNDNDLIEYVNDWTDGAGADVVFEVTGSAASTQTMTELVCARGTIVIVAIFGDPPPVDLFRLFWREIRIVGVRVYETQDFSQAINLVDKKILPLDSLISDIRPLDEIQKSFVDLSQGADIMKILIEA